MVYSKLFNFTLIVSRTNLNVKYIQKEVINSNQDKNVQIILFN